MAGLRVQAQFTSREFQCNNIRTRKLQTHRRYIFPIPIAASIMGNIPPAEPPRQIKIFKKSSEKFDCGGLDGRMEYWKVFQLCHLTEGGEGTK